MIDAFCVLFVLQDCAYSPSAVNLSQNGEPPRPLCDHHASITNNAWPPYGCKGAPRRECAVCGSLWGGRGGLGVRAMIAKQRQ